MRTLARYLAVLLAVGGLCGLDGGAVRRLATPLTVAPISRNALKGVVGERFMTAWFRKNSWEQLPSQHSGSHGLDGLFVKRTRNGVIQEVLIVEAKSEGSQLQRLVTGEKQGSPAYNRLQMDRKIAELGRDLAQRPGDTDLHRQLQDARNVRRFLQAGAYRTVLFHASAADGHLELSQYPLLPQGDLDVQRARDPSLRMRVPLSDAGLADLPTPSQRAFATDVRDLLVDLLGELSPHDDDVRATRLALRRGELRTFDDVHRHLVREPAFQRAALRSGPGARIHRLAPGNATQSFDDLAEAAARRVGARYVGRTTGALLSNGKLVIPRLAAGVKGPAVVAGALVIADSALAYREYAAGRITATQWEERLLDTSITAGTQLAASVVAVALGATPAGWVVLVVSSGAYLAADYAVQEYRASQAAAHLTADEMNVLGLTPFPLHAQLGTPWALRYVPLRRPWEPSGPPLRRPWDDLADTASATAAAATIPSVGAP